MLAYFFHAKNRINVNSTLIIERTQNTQHRRSWQRRMGVEPTGDRAERPPSRFEDGETHRGPYTSTHVWLYFAMHFYACQAYAYCFPIAWMRSTSTSVRSFTINSALRRPGRSRLPATAIQRIPAACAASTPATASSITRHTAGSLC